MVRVGREGSRIRKCRRCSGVVGFSWTRWGTGRAESENPRRLPRREAQHEPKLRGGLQNHPQTTGGFVQREGLSGHT